MGTPHSFCYVHGALYFAVAKRILATEQAEAILFFIYFLIRINFPCLGYLKKQVKADPVPAAWVTLYPFISYHGMRLEKEREELRLTRNRMGRESP